MEKWKSKSGILPLVDGKKCVSRVGICSLRITHSIYYYRNSNMYYIGEDEQHDNISLRWQIERINYLIMDLVKGLLYTTGLALMIYSLGDSKHKKFTTW